MGVSGIPLTEFEVLARRLELDDFELQCLEAIDDVYLKTVAEKMERESVTNR